VKRILAGIEGCEPQRRMETLAELMLLSGLRSLGPPIEREAKQMPLLNDIMDHPVLGRERKRGIKLGLEQGREEGREEGERQLLLRMMDKRFGPVTASVKKRILALSVPKIERIALRLLDARSLDDLLN